MTTNPLYATRERMFEALVTNLESVLLPGSAERIRVALMGGGSHLPVEDRLVEQFFDHLETEAGSRNVRPQAGESTGRGSTFTFRWLDNKTPLQRALDALPLKPESRAVLADQLGWDLGRFTAGEAAREVVGKLSNRDFREAHYEDAFQWAADPNEIRMERILFNRFRDALDPAEQKALARTWAESPDATGSAGLSDSNLVNRIADHLAMTGRIPADDWRRTERPPIGSTSGSTGSTEGAPAEPAEAARRSFVR